MNKESPDDIAINEIRRRAMDISARFDHDPRKYLDHLRALAKQHPHLMISHPRGATPKVAREESSD